MQITSRFPPRFVVIVSLLVSSLTQLHALGQPRYVEEKCSPGCFSVASGGSLATIFVDRNDYPGIARAAGDLQADIGRVVGQTPQLVDTGAGKGDAIIVGTIGHSALIDRLIKSKKIDVSRACRASGRRSSFRWSAMPLPGVKSRAGDCRQRQARDDLRHLRSVGADRRLALVLVGGCAGRAQATRCS